MLLLLFLALLPADPVSAAEQVSRTEGSRTIVIKNADSMRRNSKDNSITLNGNVQIIFGDHSLTTTEAIIRQNQKEIETTGPFLLSTTSVIVSGERAVVNYADKTGTIYNGIIKMDQVIFEGDIIYKRGEKEYEVVKAEYSACTTCPPAWNFTGTKIKATSGGYAHIQNPVLKIVKMPILWLPYLMVPLNSKRQTGLLFPGFAYSQKSGFGYNQAFFWAISESTDATITGKYWARRGIKGLVNYRYVLDEKSKGEADVGVIRDKLLSNDSYFREIGKDGQRIDRWHTKYTHTYTLPYDFTHRVDLNLASDLRYGRDFTSEFSGWGDPATENRTSLTRNTESTHVSADASLYVNQIKADPLADNLDSVHRFPELRLSTAPQRILGSPLLFQFDSRYNNFAREWYAFDDRERSATEFVPETTPARIGVYNSESDLIRTGQRLDFQPRISLPIPLGPYVDVLPSVAYRETQYRFPLPEQQSAERRMLRSDLSFRTRFSRIFGDQEDPKSQRYRHEVVPEVTYTSIPWVARQRHPFFGPRDEEAFFTSNTALNDVDDNKQFDYHDRLYERNLVTFSLSNYLIRKKWIDDLASYSRIALFRLSQSYDYYESIQKYDPRQPWSDISALLDVRLDWLETNSLTRYYPYQNVATTASRLRLIHPDRHFLELNYSLDFQIQKGQQVNAKARTEDLIVSAGTYLKNLSVAGNTTYSYVTHKFTNYGYLATVKPPGDCWHISLGQSFTQDDVVYTFSAAFLFDGKTATDLSGNNKLMN